MKLHSVVRYLDPKDPVLKRKHGPGSEAKTRQRRDTHFQHAAKTSNLHQYSTSATSNPNSYVYITEDLVAQAGSGETVGRSWDIR